MQYVIQRAPFSPSLPSPWDGPFWNHLPVIHVTHFHPASQSTHPSTRVKLCYDDRALYLHFRVDDRCVRATFTEYQSPVCQDSCAEFFVQPQGVAGYFNFELNPLGTLLLFHVTDPTRLEGGRLKQFVPVPADLAKQLEIHASLTQPTPSELAGPLTWTLQYVIPFSLFDPYSATPTRPIPGTRWRANFFKCGDQTSRPHWASWSPIGTALNFHAPEYFGELIFA